jgi:predicted short-subunit dehydrogenase-like oxidoreductase (DUF2520 family)
VKTRSIAVVGPGRVGLSLAAALARARMFRRITVFGRHPEPPEHPVFDDESVLWVFGLAPLDADCAAVFLAVPDDVVPELAFTLAGHGPAPEGCAAFHLSGSLPTDVLAPLHHRGFGVGAFHPLIAVGDGLRGAARFVDATVAVTAGPETLRTARAIADAIGSEVASVPAARRPLFDAAVTLASDALLPVLGQSARLMQEAGLEEDEALRALLSLVRTMLASVEEGGVPFAVAGPILRGDVEAAALHLRALEPPDRRFYALVGHERLRLCRDVPGLRGVPEQDREELSDLFRRYAEVETTEAGVGS